MNYTAMSDEDLNKYFARAFLDRPIDERTNIYWHDDDRTPSDDNSEWRPIPDYVNDWRLIRKVFVTSKVVVPPDFIPRTTRERNRRVMIALLNNTALDAAREDGK